MPVVDVVDSSWIAARAETVGAVLADPANWPRWWPGLGLRLVEQRGAKGVRWQVESVADARGCRLTGSAEVWLQPDLDGVVAHFFLRLDGAGTEPVTPTVADHVARRYRVATKHAFWALGDQLDPGRFTRLTNASHTAVDGRPAPRG